MNSLLRASFHVIFRKFPSQAFIKKVTLRDALLTYSVLLIAIVIESFFLPPLVKEEGKWLDIGFALTLDVVAFALTALISMWVINRYAKTRFSIKDIFVLQLLLTAGCRILFTLSTVVFSLLGESFVIFLGMISILFGIYLLLTFQAAISSIALITKSQAAHVILAPIIIILAGWLLILLFASSIAALM